MNLKTAYRRFKQWQRTPFDHEFSSHDTQHCHNCGHDFVGNFCPYCSQKQGLGPITWRSVGKSIAEVWGMHNRSLVYSVAQLFLRPGYFISDYINGKRQVSFPPVKMLAIIAVLGVIVDFFTGAIHGMINVEKGERMGYITNVFSWLNDHLHGAFPPPSDYLDKVFLWLNTHPDLLSLVLLSFLIIPNYFIFRFAPRNTHHTLPQGFFVQVFSTSVFMILNMFYDITSLGWLVFLLAMPLALFWSSFGLIISNYSDTMQQAIFVMWFFVVMMLLLSGLFTKETDVANGFFLNVPIAFVFLIVILGFSYFISKPRTKKQ